MINIGISSKSAALRFRGSAMTRKFFMSNQLEHMLKDTVVIKSVGLRDSEVVQLRSSFGLNKFEESDKVLSQ